MRAPISGYAVERPRSLDEALAVLAAEGDGGRAVPLAGGTDLFVYLNAGDPVGTRYLDLWGLRALRGIRVERSRTRLGALTTMSELREHAAIRRRYPSLVAAAAEVGGRQIQNRATLAGNVANASPAGDTLPVLLALDAEVIARSRHATRRIALHEFYLGYRKLALEPDELITGFVIPAPPPRTRQGFRKVGTRRAQAISKVVLGAALALDRTGRVAHARIAYGSVAPVPLRARGVGEALAGDIAPIDDIRSDRAYREAIAGNVLEQFLRDADPGFARRAR